MAVGSAGAEPLDSATTTGSVSALRQRLYDLAAVTAIFAFLIAVWYLGTIYYNYGDLREHYYVLGSLRSWNHEGFWRQLEDTLNMGFPAVPAPHQVLANLWSLLGASPSVAGNMWVNLGTTASEAVLGFLLGTLVAIVLAFAFVRSRILELSLFPYVVMSQTVPIVALVPALLVAFGSGLRAKVLIAAYLAFYPVTVSAVKGLRSVDPLANDLMRSYAASDAKTFLKLRLPASLPYLFTGLKIGITASVIGAVISELQGSNFGLGRAIIDAATYGQNIVLWSTIVCAGLLGLTLFGCVALAEKLIVKSRIGEA